MYETYVRTGNLAFLQDSYNELLINRGQEVRVIGREAEFSGIAEGIGADGRTEDRREVARMRPCIPGRYLSGDCTATFKKDRGEMG